MSKLATVYVEETNVLKEGKWLTSGMLNRNDLHVLAKYGTICVVFEVHSVVAGL
jgi:hypothetical protein